MFQTAFSFSLSQTPPLIVTRTTTIQIDTRLYYTGIACRNRLHTSQVVLFEPASGLFTGMHGPLNYDYTHSHIHNTYIHMHRRTHLYTTIMTTHILTFTQHIHTHAQAYSSVHNDYDHTQAHTRTHTHTHTHTHTPVSYTHLTLPTSSTV